MRKYNKIIGPLLLFLLIDIHTTMGQTCTPTTNNGALRPCGIESSKICSTPYIYQYDVSDINQHSLILFWDQFFSGSPLPGT